MNNLVPLVLLSFGLVSSFARSEEHPLKVEFVISRTRSDIFFKPATGFLEAAAKSLGVQVEILEPNDNHMIAGDLVKASLSKMPKPDGVIGISNKESGVQMLKACEDAKTPFMTEVATILTAGFGGPREKHPLFIGEVLPDDERAGYDLAKYLIRRGKAAADGKIHVVGISGPRENSSSIERNLGLLRAIKDSPQAVLDQVVNTDWSKEVAGAKFTGLKTRYPQVSVVWAASDGMAIGVADAAEVMKLKPGEDIVVGGMDGTKEGIEAIRRNRIQASIGGLITEEAWALVAMYDYLNGVDFAPTDGVRIMTSMRLVTAKNVGGYSMLLNSRNWQQIDFRKFSRKYHPKMTHYNFSLDSVFKEMEPAKNHP
jgi:ABC-type sugar transport system substrate-binding protein